jgi:hypothetical protein
VRICIIYICVTQGPISGDYASRFVSTFNEYPPGVECDVMVVCNGGPLSLELSLIFSPLNPIFYPRANDDGWDISAFQDVARGPGAGYDALLCLGESNYFHREGWLLRLVQAWNKHGPGMYGPYSSNAVRAHLNTTAFFTAPKFIRIYPHQVNTRPARYEFEHGANSLWRRVHAQGHPVHLVTWDGEWEPQRWRMPRNIIWRGDQSNCLMWCNHNDGYANLDAAHKAQWQRNWDQPFK